MNHNLQWKKYPVLNDGFICLVDHMGDDSSIVQAARVSYGNDKREERLDHNIGVGSLSEADNYYSSDKYKQKQDKDRNLIRYLMSHSHTTPFEMVEFKFLVRVPMDCWRQWIRHRTASVNEYSTRYTEAIDSQQTTSPQEWRLQATDNKQGSNGYLGNDSIVTGEELSEWEAQFHRDARLLYTQRLDAGVAKEQARKDLPLSTYTEAYWKCDLHNIFNFFRLRTDRRAQYEIRMYANAMYEIVKQVCPVACEALEDYVLNARRFSAMEMECIKSIAQGHESAYNGTERSIHYWTKPPTMTNREWKAFLEKLA